MLRKILYGPESRKPVQEGVNKVANAVCVTLGPKGRSVIISRSHPSQTGMQYYQPHVTKDGVTVARNLVLDDYLENSGAMMIREAAEKTMSVAGDGTSTTCLLLQSIVNYGMELLDKGVNVQQLKTEIENAVEFVVEELKKLAIPVGEGVEKIRQIATVSANNDSSIGDLIAEAFDKIGHEGIISIEESKTTKTEVKVIDGFEFEQGWNSTTHYFVNNLSKSTCELEDVYILLYDKKIYLLEPLKNLLNQILQEGKPILIICDDADGEALATIVMNVTQGRMKACIVKAPGFGDAKRTNMEDMALLTGGVYVSDEKGYSLDKTTLKLLGRADKVTVSADKTVIVGSKGDKEKIDSLIGELRNNLSETEDTVEKEAIEKRIARLSNGVAALYVGAPTETEMKEKKDRCDDSIRAVKAAIAEGYVPGGGTAYFNIANDLSHDNSGSMLMIETLYAPIRKICENAGVDPLAVRSNLINKENKNIGYNAKEDKIEDLVEAGIIDPVKVLRCSLQHAASAAMMILFSECLICDVL